MRQDERCLLIHGSRGADVVGGGLGLVRSIKIASSMNTGVIIVSDCLHACKDLALTKAFGFSSIISML